jgi:high-affinity K+ transport system ATPase subunit B
MAVMIAQPIQFLDEVAIALGLKARDIIELTIRSRWDDLATIEIKAVMVEDQDKKVAEVLRRYRLVPIEEVPAPTADTLTPAPFDPTP